MRIKISHLTLGAAICLASSEASAYTLNNPRAGNATTLNVSPFIELFLPDHYDTLQNAAAKLDANASNMRFSLVVDNDNIVAGNNGESEVAFAAGAALACSSIACTLNWNAAGTLVESDVYFDATYFWVNTDLKADSVAYDSSLTRPLLNTALHEFSHALGLAHEANVFNVLGNAWNVVNTNGDHTESVISEDTNNGLVAHYGFRAAINQDLSLYHWEWIGSTNGYSNHGRTPITGAGGAALSAAPSFDPVLDEPAYYVTSPQTIEVRQTAENRGTFQSVTIKWYLSPNAFISTGDTLLATSIINKGINGPFTWTRSMSIPSGLAVGSRYWVGAIIDSENVLAEQNEINNAIYVAEVVIQ